MIIFIYKMDKVIIANCPATVREPHGKRLQLRDPAISESNMEIFVSIADKRDPRKSNLRLLPFGDLREKMNSL